MTDDRLPYYAALKIHADERVRAIRESAWHRLRPPDSYERSEPHITVHPGFSCDHQTAARVAGVLAYCVGDGFEVEGMSFWPGRDEPMVVKLDVDADLSVYRQTIESHIAESGGTVDRDPVPPHITLFKSGDAGDAGETLDGGPHGPHGRVEDVAGDYGGWTAEVGGYEIRRRG